MFRAVHHTRRGFLRAAAGIGAVALRAPEAAAQQVKWSAGTERPRLVAPPGTIDCQHHFDDAGYTIDPAQNLSRRCRARRLPRGEDPKPDDALLLDRLLDWAPNEGVRRRILVDNPSALYGFPAV